MASRESIIRMIVVGLLSSAAEAQTTFWQPTYGPYGGNVAGLVADSVGNVFAVEGDGRMSGSTDRGERWRPLANVPSGDVNAFLIAPNGCIFAGTMNGIYRSTNSGNSWAQTNNGLTRTEIYDLACDQSGKLYAGSYFGGISSSTNNGDSWTPLGLIYVESLFITPMGEVFAGTNSTLYKYTTSGWTQLDLSGVAVKAIGVNSLGHIFAATYWNDGSVLISTDSGAHWLLRSAGMPQYGSVFSLFINTAGKIFAGVYDAYYNRSSIYTSTDNGTEWSELALSPSGNLIQTTPTEMYFGGNGVYRSTNQGMDWTQTRYSTLSVGDIVVSSTSTVLASTSRRLFRSTNRGDTWQPLSFSLARLLAADGTGDLFAASYTVHRSMDNGITWFETNTQWSNAQVRAIAVSPNGAIFASVHPGINFPATSGFFRTTNRGSSWQRLNPDSVDLYLGTFGIDPISGEIYLYGSDRLHKSTDNGDTWNIVQSNLSVPTAISVSSTGTILVAPDTGLVHRSTDHGATWSQVNVASTSIHAFLNTRNNQIFAATDSGTFRSTNEGLSWTPLIDGLPDVGVSSLATDSAGYVYAGTGGSGIYRSSSPVTSRDVPTRQLPAAYELEQNYPNPFNPKTEIRYQTSEAGFVTLKVFDVLGREVTTLVNEVKQPGTYTVQFDGDGLASGVYFYRFQAGTFMQTKRMTLLR